MMLPIEGNTFGSIPLPYYATYTSSIISKDVALNELRILTGNLKNWVKTIKENHWENEEEVIDLMNEINKLSLEC